MEERGLAHVEIIVAFVLFIGFLFFGLYFFNPLDTKRVLDSSLYYAIDEINKNATGDLLIYSVIINESVQDPVVSFAIARGETEGSGVRAENRGGEVLPFTTSGDSVIVNRGGERFIKITFGQFSLGTTPLGKASQLTAENYTISSSETKKVISEQKMLALNQSYYDGYAALKRQFNLPGRVDFSFKLSFAPNAEIAAERTVAEGIDVFAKTERREVVQADGSITFADLTVRVW